MMLLILFRKRICPYDVVIISTPMFEKKHWDGDMADLTGQCVKVGHELFELFERYGKFMRRGSNRNMVGFRPLSLKIL